MKVRFNFGDRVVSLPHTALQKLSEASEADIKILLALTDSENSPQDYGFTDEEISSAVAFWRGAGILSLAGQPESKVAAVTKNSKKTSGKALKSEDKLPEYTSAEVKRMFTSNEALAGLLDACQQIVGKVFNTTECSIILGMHEHLALDSEYIITLLAYCVGKGKKSLHYAEKTAFSLCERDIDTPAALEAHLKTLEAYDSVEGRLRSMFGIKDRALSKKEKDCFVKWCGEWLYSLDVIERAYEATVNAIGRASVPYTDAIISKWNAAGCRTLEDIEKYDKGESKDRQTDGVQSSFDTDDFFQAALKRSYSQMKGNTEDN